MADTSTLPAKCSFSLVLEDGTKEGRYTQNMVNKAGKRMTDKAAAKNKALSAFKRYCKKHVDGDGEVRYEGTLVETTRGRGKPTWRFVALRALLNEPKVKTIFGKESVEKFSYKIEKGSVQLVSDSDSEAPPSEQSKKTTKSAKKAVAPSTKKGKKTKKAKAPEPESTDEGSEEESD